jgi:hypothetical protein
MTKERIIAANENSGGAQYVDTALISFVTLMAKAYVAETAKRKDG